MTKDKKFTFKGFYFKHPIICNLVFMVVLGLLLVWGALKFLDNWTNHGDTETVPDVRNHTFEEARSILTNSNLEIEIADSIYERALPPGTVIESFPKAGSVVKTGRPIYVTVTSFLPKKVTVTMPIINAVSERQAKSYLNALGLKDITTVYVPGHFPDLVVDARADGKAIGVGSRIPVTSRVTLEVGANAPAPAETDPSAVESEIAETVTNAFENDGGFFD